MGTRILETNEDIKEVLSPHTFDVQSDDSLGPLIEKMGEAKVVLLGEASHGTHEYYSWRARISKRLIEEKGFSFIGVEGDWPDCYRLNRFVKGYEDAGADPIEVMKGFRRWPAWMWANWEMAAFLSWLERHNRGLRQPEKVGFYGLDVYSLWESMEAIMEYLKDKDPAGLEAAKEAFLCFEPYGEGGGGSYASATHMVDESCEAEVVSLLAEIRRKVPQYNSDPEGALNVEQNATVVANAERYYRAMVRSSAQSWNLRDRHMAETLERLLEHHGPRAKAIIWEHNTHIGDARYTDMAGAGMFNIGQLAREKYGRENCFLLGFGSYRGSVIAARRWGAPMKEIEVPEAREGSWEDVLHRLGSENLAVLFGGMRQEGLLKRPLVHRAIGVVYNPAHERRSNYVPSIIPYRYDAFQFIDETQALHPLHMEPEGQKMPEAYPWGV